MGLGEQIARGEWGEAYRTRRTLPFGVVAALALRLERADTQLSVLQAHEAWAAEVAPFRDEFPYQTKRDLLRGLDARLILLKPGSVLRMLVVVGWSQTLESCARGDARWRVFLADTPESLLLASTSSDGDRVADVRHRVQVLLRPAVEASAGAIVFSTIRRFACRDTRGV